MRILGVSLSTIILVLVVWFVARRWGASVPGLNKLG